MFMSKPEHFLIMARPMRPVPMMAIVLPVTSSPRKIRVPESPPVFPGEMLGGPHAACKIAHHEKSKLGRGFSQDIGCVGEGNLVTVGIGAVDVVKTDGYLGDDFQTAFAGFENFSVNRITQS